MTRLMARDHASDYLRLQGLGYRAAAHLRVQAGPLVRLSRHVRRRLSLALSSSMPSPRTPGELVTPALEAGRMHFQDKGWVFIDSVLAERFHAEIVDTWPRRHFFEPPVDVLKSWERGFSWRRGQGEDEPRHLDRHPALASLFRDLRSQRMAERVTDLVGANEPLSCYSFLVTHAGYGATVAPHRDDWVYLSPRPRVVNLVFFIDGGTGARSGGLALLEENTFDRIVFEVSSLRNTALLYDVIAPYGRDNPYYHGFPPIGWGKYRLAIISNFVSISYPR